MNEKSRASLPAREKPFLPELGGILREIAAAGLGAWFSAAKTAAGMRPFGVAYIAAAGYPLPAAAGAFLMNLLHGSAQDGLLYCAAVTVMLTCRMLFADKPVEKNRFFAPLCATLALVIPKSIALRSGNALLLLLCEGALCGVFALLLEEAGNPRSPLRDWGKITAFLAWTLTLLPLTLFGISPARVAGSFVCMLASCFAGAAAGCCVGAVYGISVDLSAGEAPFFALIWSLSALAGGVFGKKARLENALSFCISGGLLCLWLYDQPRALPGFYEMFLAGVLLVLLPEKRLIPAERLFAGLSGETEHKKITAAAAQAMRGLSAAVEQLGSVMDGLWNGLPSADPQQDPGAVWRTAVERSCRDCPRSGVCWQKDRHTMQNLLNDLTPVLQKKHALGLPDLPAWFAGSCLQTALFCGSVNDAFREALRRRARAGELRAQQNAMRQQYASLSALLESAAGRAGAGVEYDTALESRVRRIVRAYHPGAKAGVCLVNGSLQIELLFPKETEEFLEWSPLIRTLESAFSAHFLPPEALESRKGQLFRLRQQAVFRLESYGCTRTKPGESVCGDSYRCFTTEDGRAILLLSDGMGTGERAARLSRQALELVSGFVRSGCGLAESTAAVLPVLAARFSEWGFVTLDLIEINLFSGRSAALKYGAAPGLLLREGRILRFSTRRLPAGLEEGQEDIPPFSLRLQAGDRLLLLSDGVWDACDPEALLRENAALPGKELAELLLSAGEDVSDDRTVIVADFAACG